IYAHARGRLGVSRGSLSRVMIWIYIWVVRWCHGIKADKGKEIEVANKGLKRLQEGTKGLSSSAKGTPVRRFGAKAVEPHGLTWFNTQKEAKYAPETILTKAISHLSFLPSRT
ncbi:hypothetical protein HAX54_007368, partial [Datura stramonium]|nr:hypothetical protein [Datura stramonium]